MVRFRHRCASCCFKTCVWLSVDVCRLFIQFYFYLILVILRHTTWKLNNIYISFIFMCMYICVAVHTHVVVFWCLA